MWDRIEIVPLKIWYPQELHGVPKTLSLIFRNFSLIFLKSWRIQSLEKNTCFRNVQRHELSTPSGLELFAFAAHSDETCHAPWRKQHSAGCRTWFLAATPSKISTPHSAKNPEKQVFLWTFAAKLTTSVPSSNSGQQWLNRSWLRFLLSSIFLQWSSHWRRSARWPLAVSKMFDPKAFHRWIGTLRLCLFQEIWFVPISRTFLRSRHLHHIYIYISRNLHFINTAMIYTRHTLDGWNPPKPPKAEFSPMYKDRLPSSIACMFYSIHVSRHRQELWGTNINS